MLPSRFLESKNLLANRKCMACKFIVRVSQSTIGTYTNIPYQYQHIPIQMELDLPYDLVSLIRKLTENISFIQSVGSGPEPDCNIYFDMLFEIFFVFLACSDCPSVVCQVSRECFVSNIKAFSLSLFYSIDYHNIIQDGLEWRTVEVDERSGPPHPTPPHHGVT